MQDKKIHSYIMFGLLGAVIISPVLLYNTMYVSKQKALKTVSARLEEVKKNSRAIAALITTPDAVETLKQEVSGQMDLLRSIKPTRVDILFVQKVLSLLAKKNNIIIDSLHPEKVSTPLAVEKSGNKKARKQDMSTGIEFSQIEISLRGMYDQICNYLDDIENNPEVVMAVDSLTMQCEHQAPNSVGGQIDVELRIKVYYEAG